MNKQLIPHKRPYIKKMAFGFRKQTAKPTIQDRLREYAGTIVHLTHNDLDAAGSDAVVRMKYGNEILTFFSSVGKFDWFLGQIGNYNGAGKTLIISDLGYQHDIEDKVRKAHAAGWTIMWYDHHKWTNEEETMIREHVSVLTVDTARCATGVLAIELKPNQPQVAEVAKVVCDYDLWKHEDKRSAILGIVTSGSANLQFIRDKLYQGIIIDDEVSAIYSRIEAEKNACIRKSIRRATLTDGKYRVAIMPCYGYPSETAAETRKQLNTEIELLVFDNGKFSLRSVPPISHLIAREFNGGGHPNASGGSFTYAFKEKFLFKAFHRVSGKTPFLEVTEKY